MSEGVCVRCDRECDLELERATEHCNKDQEATGWERSEWSLASSLDLWLLVGCAGAGAGAEVGCCALAVLHHKWEWAGVPLPGPEARAGDAIIGCSLYSVGRVQWANQMRVWSKKRRPETPTLGKALHSSLVSAPPAPACRLPAPSSSLDLGPSRFLPAALPRCSLTQAHQAFGCLLVLALSRAQAQPPRQLNPRASSTPLLVYLHSVSTIPDDTVTAPGPATRIDTLSCPFSTAPFWSFWSSCKHFCREALHSTPAPARQQVLSLGPACLLHHPPPASRLRPRHFSCPHLPKSASPSSTLYFAQPWSSGEQNVSPMTSNGGRCTATRHQFHTLSSGLFRTTVSSVSGRAPQF